MQIMASVCPPACRALHNDIYFFFHFQRGAARPGLVRDGRMRGREALTYQPGPGPSAGRPGRGRRVPRGDCPRAASLAILRRDSRVGRDSRMNDGRSIWEEATDFISSGGGRPLLARASPLAPSRAGQMERTWKAVRATLH